MAHKHTPPHAKHHGKGHNVAERAKNAPIGMVKQRSSLAAFLAIGLVGFAVLAVLVVAAWMIFN